MKYFLLLTIFFFSLNLNSQELMKKKGSIKVIEESFGFKKNGEKYKDHRSEIYFSKSGRILQKVTYGGWGYKIKTIGEIEHYTYSDSLLYSISKYEKRKRSNEFDLKMTIIKYDTTNSCYKISFYDYDSLKRDSIHYISELGFFNVKKVNPHFDKVIYKAGYNIFEYYTNDKLRNIYRYKHIDNCKFGTIEKLSESEQLEIVSNEKECYDSLNRIVSKEVYMGNSLDLKEKYLYFYSRNGILKKIHIFIMKREGGYYFHEIKYKVNCNVRSISPFVQEKINKMLLDE